MSTQQTMVTLTPEAQDTHDRLWQLTEWDFVADCSGFARDQEQGLFLIRSRIDPTFGALILGVDVVTALEAYFGMSKGVSIVCCCCETEESLKAIENISKAHGLTRVHTRKHGNRYGADTLGEQDGRHLSSFRRGHLDLK